MRAFSQDSQKKKNPKKIQNPHTHLLKYTDASGRNGIGLKTMNQTSASPVRRGLRKYVDEQAWGWIRVGGCLRGGRGGRSACLRCVFSCAAEVVGSRANCSLSTSLHILPFQAKRENKGRELSCCRGNEDSGTQHRRGCPQ